ncbi:MAG: DNA polymerase I [Holosporales bacterium]
MPLTLLDASGYIFRAYHALPPLSAPDGTPVGAVYGFCSMLLKLADSLPQTRALAVFDAGRQTFRQEIYTDYKAHRPPPPADLIPQFALVREAAAAFGLPGVELPGFEADDLLASYAKGVNDTISDIIIVTSDKDMLQLLRPGVRIYDPVKYAFLSDDDAVKKFGVPPAKVPDVQALIGDASDNVPGVPGIGVKTAAELILAYGDLEGVLAAAASGAITQTKRRQSLIDNAELARISYRLVCLKDDTPLPVAADAAPLLKPDRERFAAFLNKLGFRSLVARLGQPVQQTLFDDPAPTAPTIASVAISPDALIAKAKLWGALAVHQGETGWEAALPDGTAYTLNERPTLTDPAVCIIGYDFKRAGILPAWGDDVMLMAYAVEGASQSHALESLISRHAPDQQGASSLMTIWQILNTRLGERQAAAVYATLEKPLLPILARMEEAGIAVDKTVLADLSQHYGNELTRLEADIFRLAGHPFNIASPKQLGVVLFDEMGLPAPKKSKTGQYQTGSDVLEPLAEQGHAIAAGVLEWRGMAKLKGTYADALQEAINPATGRIHARFLQTVTATGRLSCAEPNLQNIPIRTAEGRKLRAAFVAPPGTMLVSLDYSQIELRLLAHCAAVPALRQAIKDGADLHAQTAQAVFGTASPEHRRRAKAVNFGIIYGISAFGLAQQLGVPKAEAAGIIERYFAAYPEIKAWMDATIAAARNDGCVTTLFGRTVFTPHIHDKNGALRQIAERAAVNAPLQGSAADLLRRAMVRLDTALHEQQLASRLVLQVHDELILECPDDEAEVVTQLARKIMVGAALPLVSLSVPLVVEAAAGQTWGAAHG